MTETELLGRAGMDHLIESVLLVLQDALVTSEELGPNDIGKRAGIPENNYKGQEIVTGVLNFLKDQKVVENHHPSDRKSYWYLLPGEYHRTYIYDTSETPGE